MNFKETTHKKTGRKTYFVDGKKVSKDKYDFNRMVCTMHNYKYNSSLVSGNQTYSWYTYSMN